MDKTWTSRKTVHWVSVSNSPKRCPYRGVKIYVLNVTLWLKCRETTRNFRSDYSDWFDRDE